MSRVAPAPAAASLELVVTAEKHRVLFPIKYDQDTHAPTAVTNTRKWGDWLTHAPLSLLKSPLAKSAAGAAVSLGSLVLQSCGHAQLALGLGLVIGATVFFMVSTALSMHDAHVRAGRIYMGELNADRTFKEKDMREAQRREMAKELLFSLLWGASAALAALGFAHFIPALLHSGSAIAHMSKPLSLSCEAVGAFAIGGGVAASLRRRDAFAADVPVYLQVVVEKPSAAEATEVDTAAAHASIGGAALASPPPASPLVEATPAPHGRSEDHADSFQAPASALPALRIVAKEQTITLKKEERDPARTWADWSKGHNSIISVFKSKAFQMLLGSGLAIGAILIREHPVGSALSAGGIALVIGISLLWATSTSLSMYAAYHRAGDDYEARIHGENLLRLLHPQTANAGQAEEEFKKSFKRIDETKRRSEQWAAVRGQLYSSLF